MQSYGVTIVRVKIMQTLEDAKEGLQLGHRNTTLIRLEEGLSFGKKSTTEPKVVGYGRTPLNSTR